MDNLSLFGHLELCQLPNLAQLENNHEADISILEDELLNSLHEYMNYRYQDFIDIEITDWLINPFNDDYSNEGNLDA